jgi:hypothetical protein
MSENQDPTIEHDAADVQVVNLTDPTRLHLHMMPGETPGEAEAREILTGRAMLAARLGAGVEIVGRWVWATFAARPPVESRAELKAAGFHWNHKRKVWQWAGVPSRSSTDDNDTLRMKHGAARFAPGV